MARCRKQAQVDVGAVFVAVRSRLKVCSQAKLCLMTENAKVAVYLSYAAPGGHALSDRELYCPDRGLRTRAAGIPEGTVFPTKPALGRRMLACVLDASVPASWVAGDGGAPPAPR